MRTEAVRGRRTCGNDAGETARFIVRALGATSTSTVCESTVLEYFYVKLCAGKAGAVHVGQSDVACRLQCCCTDFVVWEDG